MTFFVLIIVILYGGSHAESRGPVTAFRSQEDCEFVGQQEAIAISMIPGIRMSWHCDMITFGPSTTEAG